MGVCVLRILLVGRERALLWEPRWARFMRMGNNPKRLPQELQEKFCSKNPAGRLQLFNDWFYAKEDVKECVVIHRRRLEIKKKLKQLFGFRTRSDLLKMYHDDASAVDEIVRSKTRAGLWRPNPDLPTNDKHLQYWVRLDTTLSDETIRLS
eukprot:15458460-Alexandrium_andersonii.AAC.1